MEPHDPLTLTEAAEVLDVTTDELADLIGAGEIVAERHSRWDARVEIEVIEIERYVVAVEPADDEPSPEGDHDQK